MKTKKEVNLNDLDAAFFRLGYLSGLMMGASFDLALAQMYKLLTLMEQLKKDNIDLNKAITAPPERKMLTYPGWGSLNTFFASSIVAKRQIEKEEFTIKMVVLMEEEVSFVI